MDNAINKFNTIKNSFSLNFSNYVKIFVYFLLCLIILFFIVRVFRYKIKIKIESSTHINENGALLIADPVLFEKNPVLRKKNIQISSNGEHSYCFWIYIKNVNPIRTNNLIFIRRYKHATIMAHIDFANSSLVIKIYYGRNELGEGTNYTLYTVEGMRFQTWSHISIVQRGRKMDVYINGKLGRSFIMEQELFCTSVGLFEVGRRGKQMDGLISRFKYYSISIPVDKIYKNYEEGALESPNRVFSLQKVADLKLRLL
jgi:hypothetical protein